MGDKPLDHIDNSKLVSFIKKTMAWRFTISFVPGHLIPGPDAASRKPNENAEYDDKNYLDPLEIMQQH